MKKQIHVRVSPTGEITVEAHGFKGKGCEAATKGIEAALGTATRRTRKPECWRCTLTDLCAYRDKTSVL